MSDSLYTHLWYHPQTQHFESEGTCFFSLEEAIQALMDYEPSWKKHGFDYYATYAENLKNGTVKRLTLLDYPIDLSPISPAEKIYLI